MIGLAQEALLVCFTCLSLLDVFIVIVNRFHLHLSFFRFSKEMDIECFFTQKNRELTPCFSLYLFFNSFAYFNTSTPLQVP